MFATLFASLFVQGILLGLAALALLAAAPGCKNATARSGSAACGSRWRCCFWCRCTRLCPRPRRRCPWIPHRCTAGPPFRRKSPSAPPTVCLHGCHGGRRAHGLHRAPRRAQTGHRTVLERLAVGATRLNLLAFAWNLGVLAVALYQFGGYAVWRIRRPPHRHSRLTPAGAVPCRGGRARRWSPRRWYAAPWWRARASRTSDPHGHGSRRRLHAGPRADPHKTA